MKVSAAIITFNEERHIADAIRSVAWADDILVVDSGSTDATREIALRSGARVIVREWTGFSDQKQFAADNAIHDWVFSLDADERATEALRDEIVALRRSNPLHIPVAGYTVPRLAIYMGREIRHGGWYPDRQLRFFDRKRANWNGAVIHESVIVHRGEKVGELAGDILHYSVETAGQHARMIADRYAPLGARQMHERGRRTSPLRAVFAGWLAFVRGYIFRAGFLDGFPGFCIAYFASHHAFMKHLYLLELQKDKKKKPLPAESDNQE